MYEEYKNMGGNGFISEMVEDLKRLPKSLSGGKKAFLAQRKNKEK